MGIHQDSRESTKIHAGGRWEIQKETDDKGDDYEGDYKGGGVLS